MNKLHGLIQRILEDCLSRLLFFRLQMRITRSERDNFQPSLDSKELPAHRNEPEDSRNAAG